MKTAGLGVQRKLVEPHGTNEGDVGCLTVEDILLGVYPQSGQLGQHVNHLVRLQVVDEDVGHPEVFDKL